MNVRELKKEIRALGTAPKAKASAWFFKTGKGQYGEGDVFIGVTVPQQRKLAKKYQTLLLTDIEKLLHRKEHEFRLTALFMLVLQFQKGDARLQKTIYDLYFRNTKWINNWDLVDSSASYIVGAHLYKNKKSTAPLERLAKSKDVWERRIAILATAYFISQNQFTPTLRIAAKLVRDEHDLIHKAVGWMLREVGKKDIAVLEKFLQKHAATMPRTMLRYAIERFPRAKRVYYMQLSSA